MTLSRDETALLLDEKMNDQPRFFYCLPEIRGPFRPMLHILTLPVACLAEGLPDRP